MLYTCLILNALACHTPPADTNHAMLNNDENIGGGQLLRTTYSNDKLLGIGLMRDNKKHGYWYEFYTDGSIRWHGLYENGEIVDQNCSLEELDVTIMHFGQPLKRMMKDSSYEIKLISKNVHPSGVGISVPLQGLGAKFKVDLPKGSHVGYDYLFTAGDTGQLILQLFYHCRNQTHSDHEKHCKIEIVQ